MTFKVIMSAIAQFKPMFENCGPKFLKPCMRIAALLGQASLSLIQAHALGRAWMYNLGPLASGPSLD